MPRRGFKRLVEIAADSDITNVLVAKLREQAIPLDLHFTFRMQGSFDTVYVPQADLERAGTLLRLLRENRGQNGPIQ